MPINSDVVGWIYVPGTKVNYPIMHSGDDETYLTRDFYGNEGGWWMADYGAVFLSGGNRPTSRTRTTSCTGTTC